jgi:hypothetical protein
MTTPSEADVQGTDTRIDRSSASIGELIAEVSRDLTVLFRQEVELAKAEARQSVTKAGKGAGMLGGAGFAGYLAVLFVSIAIWWGLGNVIGRGWSGLVVAVVWALIAAVLALMGRREVQSVRGLPRTVETAKKIPAAMKGDEEAAR